MEWVSPALSSGLGNRLFQYAAAAGAAEKWGVPVAFYLPRCTESPHGPIASLFRMFPKVPLIDDAQSYEEIKEPSRRFYEYLPLEKESAARTVLQGFRQSWKYFPTNLTALEPDWDSALGGPAVRKWIETDAGLDREDVRRRTVAIHIRLGDYLKLPHHQQNLTYYYQKALPRIARGSRLHLFSDEPDKCRSIFADWCVRNDVRLTIARVRSDVESLYEMSLCLGGTITANSTFSWWGAWFAHAAGAPWATYPDRWGSGQPVPVDVAPPWGTVLTVA